MWQFASFIKKPEIILTQLLDYDRTSISILLRRNIMIIALISVFFLGWLLAATIGTYAYFANEPNLK